MAEAGTVAVHLGSTDAAERAEPDIIFEGVAAHDQTGISVAGDFDFTADGASFSKSQMYKHYTELAKRLWRRASALGSGVVYAQRVDGYSQTTRADEVGTSAASTFDRSGLVN